MVEWQPFQLQNTSDGAVDLTGRARAEAELAVGLARPIAAVFQQMMAQRFERDETAKAQEFAALEAARSREDQRALHAQDDMAALERVQVQIDAAERAARDARAREAAAGVLTRDFSTPVEPGAPPMDGRGPLRWDAGAFMPQGGGAIPSYAPIPDAAAGVLGRQGVDTVMSRRGIDTERATNNAENARTAQLKADAAARAAQDIEAWRKNVFSNKEIPEKDRVRIGVLSYANPEEAQREYSKMLDELRAEQRGDAEAAAKKKEAEANGLFMHPLAGMSPVGLALEVRDAPKAAPGGSLPFSSMSPRARVTVTNAARAQVSDEAFGRGDIGQADKLGLLDGTSPLYGVYQREIEDRALEIAAAYGWEGAPAPAPAAPPAPAPAETGQVSADDYGRRLIASGLSPEEQDRYMEAFEAGLPPPIVPMRKPERTERRKKNLGRGESAEESYTVKDTDPEDALIKAAKSKKAETFERAVKEYRDLYGEPPEDVRKELRRILGPQKPRSEASEAKAIQILDKVKW